MGGCRFVTFLLFVYFSRFFTKTGERGYDARIRTIISSFATRLNIRLSDLEKRYAEQLKKTVEDDKGEKLLDARKPAETRETKAKSRRRIAMISAATVAGAGLCALTAGLAAPLVAAGVGTVFGGGAAVLGSATGIAVITTLFGAAGGGLVGYKMKRRIGGLEEFRFVPITMGESLHLAIAVSGKNKKKNVTIKLSAQSPNIKLEQVGRALTIKDLQCPGQS